MPADRDRAVAAPHAHHRIGRDLDRADDDRRPVAQRLQRRCRDDLHGRKSCPATSVAPDSVAPAPIAPTSLLSTIWRNSAAGLSRCAIAPAGTTRSEEHTSELQSLMRLSYAVFCLKK